MTSPVPNQTRVKEEGCSSASCRCNCSVISSTSSDSTVDKAVQPLVPTTGTEARFGPIVNEKSNKNLVTIANNKDISMDV